MTQILILKKVSKREPYVKKNDKFKYFIGYDDNDEIRPLCIKLSQDQQFNEERF